MKKIFNLFILITISFNVNSRNSDCKQIKHKLCKSVTIIFKLCDNLIIDNDIIILDERKSSCFLFLTDTNKKHMINDVSISLSSQIPVVNNYFFKQKILGLKAIGKGDLISFLIYQMVINGRKYYIGIWYNLIINHILIDFGTLISNDKLIRLIFEFYNVKSIKKVILFVFNFMNNFYISPSYRILS